MSATDTKRRGNAHDDVEGDALLATPPEVPEVVVTAAAGAPEPIDAPEREQAIRTDRSCIVQAPAGSGKTELLSQRVLALLSIVDQPEEIVALTFTRKAAREMRERITAALLAAREPEPQEPYKRRTWALACRALERDRALGWNLLDHPARLRVTTIDSLCSSIARRLPILSGFGSVPEVTTEPDDIYARAADDLLATLEEDQPWSGALAQLLEHLDNDMGKLAELIVGMLRKRDQWLRHIAWIRSTDGATHPDARPTLERGLRNAVEDMLAQFATFFSDDARALAARLAAHAADVLDNAGSETPLAACRGLTELPISADTLAAWRGVAHMLFTTGGSPRKSVTKAIGFPPKDPYKDDLLVLIANLFEGREEEMRAAYKTLMTLPEPVYTDAQWSVVEAMIEVLKAAVGYLHTAFQIEEACDFAEIALAARTALDDGEGPTELAVSLDAAITHLLVDEFQDTSHSQFELLRRLTRDWTSGDGRTLFLVGDPMQSIYRFREAEVGLFMQAWESGIGEVALDRLSLSVNFRSTPAIVTWVNDTFSRVFPARGDIASGAVAYARSVPGRSSVGARSSVEIHARIGVDPEREAKEIIEVIQAEQADAPDAQIAVLVRDRNALLALVPALRARGLRFQAVEIDRLGQVPAISDLLALTRAISNPADRIAWLALLRAPWCGLALADLLAVAGRDRDATVWSLLQDPACRSALSADGAARLRRVTDVLDMVFAGYRRGTLRRTVEGAWLALGGPACLESEAQLRDTRRFFELIDEHEQGGEIADLDALTTAVDKLYASPDLSQDRLQIMTIHKAKGLEFDVVILPALQRPGRSDDPALLLHMERPHDGETDLLIAPIKAGDVANDPIYSFLQVLEKQKSAHELRRVLYVAATRARRRLHLFGSVKDTQLENGPSSGLLSLLYPLVQQRFLAAAEQIATDAEAAALDAPADGVRRVPRPIRRLTAAWTCPAPPPDVQWTALFEDAELELLLPRDLRRTWAEATTRHVGTVVHDLLCTIARQGIDRWTPERIDRARDAIRRALVALGVGAAELDGAVRRVVGAIEATLQDDRGRWILATSHRDAANELPVTGYIDGILRSVRVDRTFVDDEDVRWIIDYKIPHHIGGDIERYLDGERQRYREQLRGYATLLGELDPQRETRCGLYFPGLGWRDMS